MLGQCSGQDCEYTECSKDKCNDEGDLCCDTGAGVIVGDTWDNDCDAEWTRVDRVDGDGLNGGCAFITKALGGVSFTCCKTHKGTVAIWPFETSL